MSDDTGGAQRPNANYKLSKGADTEKINEENLTFYYNRERRLAKAPQSVRDLYTEQKFSRFNLIKPLIADKPRAAVFFTIIILSVMIIMLSVMGYFNKAYTLEKNKLEITGTIFEETTIIIIRKKIDSKLSVYTGAVDIAVSPPVEADTNSEADSQFPVFYNRIFFTLEPEEEYRFAVPFNSPELLIVLQTEKTSLRIKIKPE